MLHLGIGHGSISKPLLVDDVKSEAISSLPHFSDEVPDLLDGLHLLLQVCSLDEVRHLSVIMLCCYFVHRQQGLVHCLLQPKGSLHSLNSSPPVLHIRLGNCLEANTPSPHDLIVDQFLCVILLLRRSCAEPVGEAVQSDVVPSEVRGHGEIDVGGVQLHVDLLVDPSLALQVEVLLYGGHGGGGGGKEVSDYSVCVCPS